jgi:predicted HD phosphohydrolase
MGDPIGRYMHAIDSALAKQDNAVLDQLLVTDLVHGYGDMVANAHADESRKGVWLPDGGLV